MSNGKNQLEKPERNKSTIKYILGGIVTAWVTVGLLCGGYWLFEQYPEVTGGGLIFLMVTGFGALMGWTLEEGDSPVTWLRESVRRTEQPGKSNHV